MPETTTEKYSLKKGTSLEFWMHLMWWIKIAAPRLMFLGLWFLKKVPILCYQGQPLYIKVRVKTSYVRLGQKKGQALFEWYVFKGRDNKDHLPKKSGKRFQSFYQSWRQNPWRLWGIIPRRNGKALVAPSKEWALFVLNGVEQISTPNFMNFDSTHIQGLLYDNCLDIL